MTVNWLGRVAGTAPPTSGPGSLIGRRKAQILAREQLAKVSIFERILRFIQHLLHATGNAVPSGWFGLIVLAVLGIGLIIVIVAWTRPRRRRRAMAGSVLGAKPRSAEDYRRMAARLAAAGDYTEAIVEGVRAIAAELDERGILPPRLGRTANELAVEAGGELPALADDLLTAARLFDDVRYGDRPGTRAGYELVSRVDASVRTAPVSAAAATTSGGPRPPQLAGLGVPR
jgi:hypothetical protein